MTHPSLVATVVTGDCGNSLKCPLVCDAFWGACANGTWRGGGLSSASVSSARWRVHIRSWEAAARKEQDPFQHLIPSSATTPLSGYKRDENLQRNTLCASLDTFNRSVVIFFQTLSLNSLNYPFPSQRALFEPYSLLQATFRRSPQPLRFEWKSCIYRKSSCNLYYTRAV